MEFLLEGTFDIRVEEERTGNNQLCIGNLLCDLAECLQQLLNVLKGDMSVVGPRPPLPEEVAQYNQTYATRMLVKPGITGPWQVSGRSNLSEEESEALDVTYVQNWSMLGDIVLLFRTVGAVLTHKGAY